MPKAKRPTIDVSEPRKRNQKDDDGACVLDPQSQKVHKKYKDQIKAFQAILFVKFGLGMYEKKVGSFEVIYASMSQELESFFKTISPSKQEFMRKFIPAEEINKEYILNV